MDYAVPFGTARDPEGLLEALTGACGDELARLVGRPETRLRAVLGIADTEVLVETTDEFTESGTVLVAGERIDYSTKMHNALRDLTRPTYSDRVALYGGGLVDRQVGTSVALYDGGWSTREQARSEFSAQRASGDGLVQFAVDRGFPPPLVEMTEDDIRAYVQLRMYLRAGTWWAAFQVLETMFNWAAGAGTNGATFIDPVDFEVWLRIPTLPYTTALLHRHLWLGDRATLCRVISARTDGGVGCELLLTKTTGPLFQADGLSDGQTGLSWRLLAFTLDLGNTYGSATPGTGACYTINAGKVVILIHAFDADIPYTYLMSASIVSVDGRYKAGKSLIDATMTGLMAAPPPIYKAAEYALQPFAPIVEAVLREIVPAGVVVKAYESA